ncbi:MAG: radical SAM protein [Nanoarchaeota archaeon]
MVKTDAFGVKSTGTFAQQFAIIKDSRHAPVVYKRRGSDPKVLFVYHNDIEDGFIHPALAILGGQLEENSINHRLFDTSFLRDIHSQHKESVRELRERIGEEKPAGYVPTRRVVDLSEEFYKTVEEFRPDLIALSSTSYDFLGATDFILKAKREFKIPVIVGGPHAMVAPYRAIKNPAIDMVCIGEGEKPLLNLIQRINSEKDVTEIRSLWFKDPENSAHIIRNPKEKGIENLDELPLPDWDMFDKRHIERPWMGKLTRQGYVEISRGCPFKCSYCIQPSLHDIPNEGGKTDNTQYKFHSNAEKIVGRIKELRNKYKFNHIQLIDENMPTMPYKDLEILAEVWNRELNTPENPITFFTMSRPEYLVIRHPDLKDGAGKQLLRDGRGLSVGKAEILASMGCTAVAMGAESGNEWLRREVLNRPMETGFLEAASEVLMRNGIHVSLYNIIGFPFETEKMIYDTIEQLWRIKPDRYSVRHLTPYPGTPIRATAELYKFIDPDYEDKPGGAKSFLHEPVMRLPKNYDMSNVQVPDYDEHGNLKGFKSAFHPEGQIIDHPSHAEQMEIRKLFGIYGFSPTKEMWPIIDLARDKGISKGNSELQALAYESFSKARANQSEDDDSYRPDLDTRLITSEDVPWANGDEYLYVGRPRALLPVLELAGGRGYARHISGLADYVKGHLEADYRKRQEMNIDLLETRLSGGEAAKQHDKAGMMITGM